MAALLIFLPLLLIFYMHLSIKKVPIWQRQPIKRGHRSNPEHWLIAGGTGLIGSALAKALIERGDTVTILARNAGKAINLFGPHIDVVTDLDKIPADTQIDRMVNLVGEPLAGGLWTKARKARFFDSRVGTAKALNDLAARLKKKPGLLVAGSAIGYYGNQPEGEQTENSPAGSDFMSSVCTAWENESQKGEQLFKRVVYLRTGIVLATEGGLLPPLKLAGLFGAATVLGSGKHWMSWISLRDITELILHIACQNTLRGPVNATSPYPEQQKAFQKILAGVLRRPQFMWVPAWPLKLLLRDMADLLLTGQKVIPATAKASGFTFEHKTLEQALTDLWAPKQQEKQAVSVFYNDTCPVCDKEINHYMGLTQSVQSAQSAQSRLTFIPFSAAPDTLSAFGLSPNDVERRLYAQLGDQQMIGGVDAFLAIWDQIPRYRIVAAVIKRQPFRFVADFFYESIAVPWLGFLNNRRKKRSKPIAR